VRSRRIARLAEARQRTAAAGIPPLTMEGIEADGSGQRASQLG